MSSRPVTTQIARAAVVFFGRSGALTQQARPRGVPRQALDREARGAYAAVEGSAAQQHLPERRQRVAELEARVADLQRQLRDAVVRGAEHRAAFAGTGQALGVSLSAVHALWGVLLPRPPAGARRGRRAQGAGRRAGAVPAVLDSSSRARARPGAADEIFGGPQPVLRTVEPHSRCWRGARLAPSRDGQEWAAEFRQLPAAEPVRRDGGQGLAKGVARVSAERQAAGQEPRAAPGDHFHILQRGQRALHAVRRQVTRALGAADKAQQPIGRDRQAGVPLAGAVVGAANRRWQEAEAACDRWAAPDAAWRQLRAALRLVTPQR